MSTPHEDAVKNKLSLITVAMAQNNFFTPHEMARCVGWICGQGETRQSWGLGVRIPVQLTDMRDSIERATEIYNILVTQKTDESKHHNVITLTRNVMISFPPPVIPVPPIKELKNVTFDRDRFDAWAAVMCPRCMKGDVGKCPCSRSIRDREAGGEGGTAPPTRKQLEEEWERQQKLGWACIAQICPKCGGSSAANCACAREAFVNAGLERAERLSNRE
jgi:hypothetical protein